jgi:hypothetical protein
MAWQRLGRSSGPLVIARLFLSYAALWIRAAEDISTRKRSVGTESCLTSPDHRLKLDKRCQLFIRSRNETLSIVAMRIGNESLCAH